MPTCRERNVAANSCSKVGTKSSGKRGIVAKVPDGIAVSSVEAGLGEPALVPGDLLPLLSTAPFRGMEEVDEVEDSKAQATDA